jgi:signal transduction histidine kinase
MLTEQFLLTLTLPSAFVLLALAGWRMRARQSARPWSATLLAAAFWASSIVSFYLGAGVPAESGFVWRIAGRYALSVVAFLLFLTTVRFLQGAPSLFRAGLTISVLLVGGSIALDPGLWPTAGGSVQVGARRVTYFSLWSVVWVASWVLPLLGAWLVVRQTAMQMPRSLYRNRLAYWQLTLLLFLIGGGVALVQQPRQPAWQEIGAVIQIAAAMLGNITLQRDDLPNLRPVLRQVTTRLASTATVFILTWLLLWFLSRAYVPSGPGATGVELLARTALLAVVILIVHYLVERAVRWLLLTRRKHPRAELAREPELAPRLASPTHLANLVLRLVQVTLVTDQAHLFRVETGPGGSLVLEGLASLQEGDTPLPLLLPGTSPLNAFLRRENTEPVSPFDLRQSQAFAGITDTEQQTVDGWNSQFLLPLQAGKQLAGVLALGDKLTGAPYNDEELNWLQSLAAQTGPLLWQAEQIATLERLNHYIFERVDKLSQEQQFLQELSKLYRQFTSLVSPELYTPFSSINSALQELEAEGATAAVSQPLTELRTMLGHLVNVAERVQQQREFHFAPMLLNDVVQESVRNLALMAEARRVTITVNGDTRQPTITGDEERLGEAVYHLLHNAIKFNRIGGSVELESGMVGNEIYLYVRDTGVGVPPERVADIWSAVSQRYNGHYRGSSDGVGLLLARFIVSAHGGRIEMSSKYGSGSTFSIYLPLALEA